MTKLVVIMHNLRSCLNVGAILRTADGLGLDKVYFSGYTPYPLAPNDERLPHISKKVTDRIHKAALGAENSVDWVHLSDIKSEIKTLREQGYTISALEQSANAILLPEYQVPNKLVIIIGNEVKGIDQDTLALSDIQLEIPMLGKKESFNVAVAAAMAFYHCRFH